ncbi:integration host factor subunit alpha [Pasteurella atlantica]|uniref:integration host factor subunit alpha n=1 Tax=Pasteurellaceae TaxID=712 RepID=UPI0027753FBB|nr:integration host factor subunit alpha [Pasteurella atlantica]MDP8034300.1 integration host factor subunit alpha [Pasteurella atlantica]MDP8036229.1 integration host factor subunit alpha [Pasteurella atlantica]MDP8038179.1 integration host factor subunit alpha [Pasteurella atlantica]MDP8048538.1 integration host factor subunit alpha [Pasteurella atlantica]MDP8050490.1 integration host factor subunit alpha [Pasteurella atlantica]
MTLTKIEMIEHIIKQLELDKKTAREFVEQFFEEIRVALEKGDEVKLSGFGNFRVREKEARPGRNPRTREPVAVSARRVVTFKPSQKLKDRIEEANK